MNEPLADSFQRPIRYLRISVTDRCNLRCQYCMPEEGIPLMKHDDILRYEEIARLVAVAAQLGISSIRLTGGEPLVRKDLASLVAMIAAIPGIEDISLTTNGTLLAKYAASLAAAGLKRVNISLDSLVPERYRAITRGGNLEDVLAGIAAAYRAGLTPVKINVVVARGVNDTELEEFARRTRDEGWNVRFIELMPIGAGIAPSHEQFMPATEIQKRIEAAYGPLQAGELYGSGPARYWRIPGASGTIGFIDALSRHFCPQCNRLRLSADGRILPCLFADMEFDVRGPLRSGASDQELACLIEKVIAAKPAGRYFAQQPAPEGRTMSRMGG